MIEDGILFTFLKGRQNLENVDPLIDRLAGLFGHARVCVAKAQEYPAPRAVAASGFWLVPEPGNAPTAPDASSGPWE